MGGSHRGDTKKKSGHVHSAGGGPGVGAMLMPLGGAHPHQWAEFLGEHEQPQET